MDAIRHWVTTGALSDPDVVRYAATVSVWGRWFIWLAGVFLLAYRPGFWYPQDIEFLAIPVLLGVVNGLVHLRLLTNRSVTWRWMLLLSATDIALITFGIVIGGGFRSFIFLAYYPSLAVFAVVFSSYWLSLAWTTVVAVAYAVVCLSVGSGLDLAAATRRCCWPGGGDVHHRAGHQFHHQVRTHQVADLGVQGAGAAAGTHRALPDDSRHHRSDRLHDRPWGFTGPGNWPGDSNEDLVAALDATSALSRSAMWEMRGPIDAGHILEGRDLGRVLWSHCATFERITGVPTGMSQSGTEPPLATETRTRLLSIAHNALTNAFLHARPGRVEVRLSFEAGRITLSVSDDGVGLPDGHAERGRGFSGMTADAEQMGGTLLVESVQGGGTTITCLVPREADAAGSE